MLALPRPLFPLSVAVAIGLAAVMGPGTPARAACADRPACKGCGCKGGPGYRGPDGRCVGFASLARVCGDPPTARCSFENAPGTGANRECAGVPEPGGAGRAAGDAAGDAAGGAAGASADVE